MQITGKAMALFGVLLVVVFMLGALCVAPLVLSNMHYGFGTMGRFTPGLGLFGFGLRGFGGLVALVLIVALVWWLASRNKVAPASVPASIATPVTPAVVEAKPCPNCQRATQSDWQVCAYCGHKLAAEVSA